MAWRKSYIAVVFQLEVKYGEISAQLGPSVLRILFPFSLSFFLYCSLAGIKFIQRKWERQSGINIKPTQGPNGMQTFCIYRSHCPLAHLTQQSSQDALYHPT